MTKRKVAAMPSVRRLPSYLNLIKQLRPQCGEYISGTFIADSLGLEPIQVRKDLELTGITGKPKLGYPVKELVSAITHFLGWDSTREAVVVGAGNLGSALMGHSVFRSHGLKIVAAFDSDPQKTGTKIHGIKVFPIKQLESRISKLGCHTALLTVPQDEAQYAACILVKAGITAIWNFTNAQLNTPSGVVIQNEDLSSGYAMLCAMAINPVEPTVK